MRHYIIYIDMKCTVGYIKLRKYTIYIENTVIVAQLHVLHVHTRNKPHNVHR